MPPQSSTASTPYRFDELARAVKQLYPGLANQNDAELVHALVQLHPQLKSLIVADPLEGIEMAGGVPSPRVGGIPGVEFPPPLERVLPATVPTPETLAPPAGFEALTTGVRTVPAISGAILGGLATGPSVGGVPAGVVAGGAAGASFGEAAAQELELFAGTRADRSFGTVLTETALGGLPVQPLKPGATISRGVLRRFLQGAGFATSSEASRAFVERGELPELDQLVQIALLGGTFGGSLGTIEGYLAHRTAQLSSKLSGGSPSVAAQIQEQLDKALLEEVEAAVMAREARRLRFGELQQGGIGARAAVGMAESGAPIPPPISQRLLPAGDPAGGGLTVLPPGQSVSIPGEGIYKSGQPDAPSIEAQLADDLAMSLETATPGVPRLIPVKALRLTADVESPPIPSPVLGRLPGMARNTPTGGQLTRTAAQRLPGDEGVSVIGTDQPVLPLERQRAARDTDLSEVPDEAVVEGHPFLAAATTAMSEGYQGSEVELYRRFLEQVEIADAVNAELASAQGDPAAILRYIAAAGGIDTAGAANVRGFGDAIERMRGLRDLDARSRPSGGTIAAVPRVLRRGGQRLEDLLERFKTDPEAGAFRGITTVDELVAAVEAAKYAPPPTRLAPDLGPGWWQRGWASDAAGDLAERLEVDAPTDTGLAVGTLDNLQQQQLRILNGADAPVDEALARLGPARARYIGEMQMDPAEPPIQLYNIEGDHPRFGSTVSAETLTAEGIPTPPATLDLLRQEQATFGQAGLLNRLLHNQRGVFILNVAPGDGPGLRTWVDRVRKDYGDTEWFARVQQSLDDGNDLRAWRLAAAASMRSISRAGVASLTPEQRAQVDSLSYAAATGRTRHVGRTEIVQPPLVSTGTRGAAGAGVTVGKGGILKPPPVRRPLDPRASDPLIGRAVIKMVLDQTMAGDITLIEGNTDTAFRLFRQVAEQSLQGANTQELKQYLNLTDAEIGSHFVRTYSQIGKMLADLSTWRRQHADEIEILRRIGGGSGLDQPPAPTLAIRTGRGQVVRLKAGQRVTDETLDALVKDGSSLDKLQAIIAIGRPEPQSISTFGALETISRMAMISQPVTAIRNLWSQTGRYGAGVVNEALAGVFSAAGGDLAGSRGHFQFASELVKAPFRKMAGAYRPWTDDLQTMFDYTAQSLKGLSPNDGRKSLAVLDTFPKHVADFFGYAAGELSREYKRTGNKLLDDMLDPSFRNMLTVLNRSQEYMTRATIFDATFRAQLRQAGLDPAKALAGPDFTQTLSDALGPEQLDDLVRSSTMTALDWTFASQPLSHSLPGLAVRFFNAFPLFRMGYPFPRFNFVSAPRFIYDHSPAGLLELIRAPWQMHKIAPLGVDAASAVSPATPTSRLALGTLSKRIQGEFMPEILGKKAAAEGEVGKSLRSLLESKRELAVRNRLLTRAQKKLEQAQKMREGQPDLLAARVEGAAATAADAQAGVERIGKRVAEATFARDQALERYRLLGAQEQELRRKVQMAEQIGAPDLPEFWARQATGTLGLLGTAMVMRTSEGASDTEWYQYRIDRGDGESTTLDLRPFAPFVQFLLPADVLVSFHDDTNWEAVRQQYAFDEMGQPRPYLDPLTAAAILWQNYEGKYTAETLTGDFLEAFLSMSRAAGTTLTLTDLVRGYGITPEGIAQALVGTIGQFLSRLTIPFRPLRDVVGAFDPEEAKVRVPPGVEADAPYGPLSAPLANIPYASQLIPETISQTSGEPLRSIDPLTRQLTGVGQQRVDRVQRELIKTGVPGRSFYLPRSGDQGIDNLAAEYYAQLLDQVLPTILETPIYTTQSPAIKRDLLVERVLPNLRAGARALTAATLGVTAIDQATMGDEERRRRTRWQRALDQMQTREEAMGRPQPVLPEVSDEELGLEAVPEGEF